MPTRCAQTTAAAQKRLHCGRVLRPASSAAAPCKQLFRRCCYLRCRKRQSGVLVRRCSVAPLATLCRTGAAAWLANITCSTPPAVQLHRRAGATADAHSWLLFPVSFLVSSARHSIPSQVAAAGLCSCCLTAAPGWGGLWQPSTSLQAATGSTCKRVRGCESSGARTSNLHPDTANPAGLWGQACHKL
jgi:hypothetical protein